MSLTYRTPPDEMEAERLALITRWWRVRHLMAPLLQEGSRLALVQCKADSWGTCKHISWIEFERLVSDAEAKASRKPPAKEEQHATAAQAHPAGRQVS